MTGGPGPVDAVLIGVTRILRQPGTRHPLTRDVYLDGLVVGDAEVPPTTPVTADLVLEAIGDAVTASGTVRTTAQCSCRRCCDPFEMVVAAEVQEIFEPRPVEGETYPLDGESIDLAPLVRDAVLLALPLAPLCRDDCPGPAPQTFPTGGAVEDAEPPGGPGPDAAADDATTAEEDPPGDPRWAALRDLRLER